MKHRKTTLLALALLFSVNTLVAQAKYDYAVLLYTMGYKHVMLATNGEKYEEIDITDMKDFNKIGANPALRELNKLEDDGWELFDTEFTGAIYLFFLRRKEQ